MKSYFQRFTDCCTESLRSQIRDLKYEKRMLNFEIKQLEESAAFWKKAFDKAKSFDGYQTFNRQEAKILELKQTIKGIVNFYPRKNLNLMQVYALDNAKELLETLDKNV